MRLTSRFTPLIILAGFLLFSLVAAQGTGSVETVENHYTIIRSRWEGQGVATVELQGMFDERPVLSDIGLIRFVGIPAQKNREAIVHPMRFQLWRKILESEQPHREVTYRDQFGEHDIVTDQAEWLILPSINETLAIGDLSKGEGQHYVAYDVIERTSINQTVVITDALGTREVTLTAPEFFAVPVEKNHAGTSSRIIDDRVHLAIYRMQQTVSVDVTVDMGDQFRNESVDLFIIFYLAVPAEKLSE